MKGLILVAWLLYLASLPKNILAQESIQSGPITVSAMELAAAYNVLSPKADIKFTNRQLYITGIVEEIFYPMWKAVTGSSESAIHLRTNKIESPNVSLLTIEYKHTSKTLLKSLLKLKSGDKVGLKGFCKGFNPISIPNDIYIDIDGDKSSFNDSAEKTKINPSSHSEVSGYKTVSWKELANAYYDNEERADQKYGNKILILTGTIFNIEYPDWKEHMSTRISLGLIHPGIGAIAVLIDYQKTTEEGLDFLSKARPGDKVYIKCFCKGLDHVDNGGNVMCVVDDSQ